MAGKGFVGVAGKRMSALQQALRQEPQAGTPEHDAWRDTVVSRATALFRMVGRRAALDCMKPAQGGRLSELLAEATEASRKLAAAR